MTRLGSIFSPSQILGHPRLVKQSSSGRGLSKNLRTPYTAEFEVKLPGCVPEVIKVEVDTTKQHTIRWKTRMQSASSVGTPKRTGIAISGKESFKSVVAGKAWREAQEELALANAVSHIGPRPPARVEAENWKKKEAAKAKVDEMAKQWRWAAAAARAAALATNGDVTACLPEEPIAGENTSLPAGSCNLYNYPQVISEEHPTGTRPSDAGLKILEKIVTALMLETKAFDEPDEVGAYAIHALVVCNTPESLLLALELYQKHTASHKLLHVPHRNGTPLFVGESALHILAVNRHEEELVQVLEYAVEHLEPAEVRRILRSQATGTFFRDTPMVFYGGTALGFAIAFEMPDAVRAMLATGHVTLNDRELACQLSGFLPIHACIANSLPGMYDLLTRELVCLTIESPGLHSSAVPTPLLSSREIFSTPAQPPELRSDETHMVRKGKRMDLQLYDLSCMQLAAQLGDHKMLRHMLRKQCNVNWVWGPVTSFSLDLNGIDSAGAGGGDIMELITRMGASKATTSMLLDSFMNGVSA